MLEKGRILTNFTKNVLSVNFQQTRNTFVLKRRYPVSLAKKEQAPRPLRSRDYTYDFVENLDHRPHPLMKVILTHNVKGFGYAGDIIEAKPNTAYNHILMPQFGVYDTPENRIKFNCVGKDVISKSYLLWEQTLDLLSKKILYIPMNKYQPWKLEPRHVSLALRRNDYVVPEYAIQMPPGDISGPDFSLETKEFFVTVTINKREDVNVRCRIEHWSMEIKDEDEVVKEKTYKPLFPEQAEILEAMEIVE